MNPANQLLRLDAIGLLEIKSYEGLGPNTKLVNGRVIYFPYYCQSHVLTVGWGHVVASGEDFSKGITIEQANSLLQSDMVRYEMQVKRDCSVPLGQAEFNALVSLDYNTGEAPLFGSMGHYLNLGDKRGAAAHFLDWILAGPPGKLEVSEGLVRRRLCEANYFLTGKLELVQSHQTAITMLDKLIAEGILNKTGRYNAIRQSVDGERPIRGLAFQADPQSSLC